MTKIKWVQLNSNEQLEDLIRKSTEKSQLIFKYSSRCGLSRTMLNRLENDWQPNEITNIDPIFLDILNAREISDNVEKKFGVRHESPQILVIKNGECIYDNSHIQIDYSKIKEHLNKFLKF